MSTSNPIQPAVSAGEAQEVNNAAGVAIAESAQPATAEVAASESAATAAILEPSTDMPAGDDADGEFSMEDFGKILAEHEQSHRSEISEGEVVKGRVVKITDQNVII
ncbi:MAG TPA: hypothetical protein VKE91_01870, partial [Blastocatellia bacterium]|nr:hypothetical protein [Blastocatellia bacterium]